MKPRRKNDLVGSIGGLFLTIFILMMAGNNSSLGDVELLLIPFLSVLIWAPFILWIAVKQHKQSVKDKQELEAKFEAQDAELLSQSTKNHG